VVAQPSAVPLRRRRRRQLRDVIITLRRPRQRHFTPPSSPRQPPSRRSSLRMSFFDHFRLYARQSADRSDMMSAHCCIPYCSDGGIPAQFVLGRGSCYLTSAVAEAWDRVISCICDFVCL